MTDGDKNLKGLKVAMTSALVAIVFFLGGFSFVLKKNYETLVQRDVQIGTLKQSVTALKDENEQITRYLAENNARIKRALESVTSLGETMDKSIAGKDKALQEAQKQLSALQDELEKDINERELTISELAQKNIKLKNEIQAVKTNEDVKNFLIAGQNMGLTDAIIIASANPEKKTVTLINIPRDLFYKGQKINELNSKYGIEKLEQAVHEITGLTAEKYAVFSFDAFVKVIDGLGGIDVNVTKNITDNQYPGPDFSYTLVSFKKGIQHMDGETALKYVRSRKSTSDFDRSYRQQEIIAAIKQKVNNLNLLSQLSAYMSLYQGIQELVKTDISAYEALAYYDEMKNYKFETGNVISSGNFLYSKMSKNGQYILLPAGGNYAKIKEYVSGLINN